MRGAPGGGTWAPRAPAAPPRPNPAPLRIFRPHAVDAGGGPLGRLDFLHTHKRSEHVDRVDRLGDEDSAPVARQGPASLHVVIALRAPPGDRDRRSLDAAEALR